MPYYDRIQALIHRLEALPNKQFNIQRPSSHPRYVKTISDLHAFQNSSFYHPTVCVSGLLALCSEFHNNGGNRLRNGEAVYHGLTGHRALASYLGISFRQARELYYPLYYPWYRNRRKTAIKRLKTLLKETS